MNTLMLLFLVGQHTVNELQKHLNVTYRQVQIRVQDDHLGPKKGLKEIAFVISMNGKRFDQESSIKVDVYPGETMFEKKGEPTPLASATRNQITSPCPIPNQS